MGPQIWKGIFNLMQMYGWFWWISVHDLCLGHKNTCLVCMSELTPPGLVWCWYGKFVYFVCELVFVVIIILLTTSWNGLQNVSNNKLLDPWMWARRDGCSMVMNFSGPGLTASVRISFALIKWKDVSSPIQKNMYCKSYVYIYMTYNTIYIHIILILQKSGKNRT